MLADKVDETEEGNLILAGDFNARTGEEGNLIGYEDELQRKSKDKTTNMQGKILLETISERGWNILNGSTNGDEEGEYTYIGARGETVIDYAIANTDAIEEIEQMKVEARIESDQQPITIQLKYKMHKQHQIEETIKRPTTL